MAITCPACGSDDAVPPRELRSLRKAVPGASATPASLVAQEVAAFAREAGQERRRHAQSHRALKIFEALLFIVSVPVLVPVLLLLLFQTKRWGRIP
jgi:hypothetical protein